MRPALDVARDLTEGSADNHCQHATWGTACPECVAKAITAARAEGATSIIETHRCGDNSCVFGPPGGMATNGGCQCLKGSPIELRRKLMLVAKDIRKLAAACREGEL
jgi:hypothetical protein